MRKKLLINESQMKRLLENSVEERSLVDVAKALKNVECTGESVKTIVKRELNRLEYNDVRISFIGYEEETNNLMYSIYTEGPMFVIKAQSSGQDVPCLNIIYVQAYNKI
jgi:hypothetical protein